MRRIYFGYISLILFFLPVSAASGQASGMFEVERLPLSSGQFNEMSAVLLEKGIVFCSDRRTSGVVNNKTFDGDRVYNIFFAERKDTLDWGRPEIYSDDLQSIFNQGPFCLSPDGQHIYFTSDVERGSSAFKRTFENRRGILIADKTGGGWSEPRPFEYNDPLWNLGHPFISNDGKYLFFSSDIPGGYGGSDLYMCRWEDGSWSEPENLGAMINSGGSELYPFFTNTGELYFASDRAGGIGGLDIYSSRKKNDSWTAPILLPEPVNSEADDFSLTRATDGSEGFFASNRERTDDIYRFTSSLRRMSECKEIIFDTYCFEFKDKNAMRFDSLPFEYEWDFDDGTTLRTTTAIAEHCFENPGIYIVKLNAIDIITGEIEKNEDTYMLDIKRTQQPFIEAPDTCAAGDVITFDASQTYLPEWDIEEYYWNFDDGTAARGIETEKTFLVEGSYDVQLIISSYPDEEGNIKETCVRRTIVVEER